MFNAFEKWKSLNTPVYIYSSGSIFAQKLLFGHTANGNLLPFLNGHYDTTIGMKVEVESYSRIFNEISNNEYSVDAVLFVTDNVLEYEAAVNAGMQSVIAVRPGNAPLPEDKEYNTLDSFTVLFDKFKFGQ